MDYHAKDDNAITKTCLFDSDTWLLDDTWAWQREIALIDGNLTSIVSLTFSSVYVYRFGTNNFLWIMWITEEAQKKHKGVSPIHFISKENAYFW